MSLTGIPPSRFTELNAHTPTKDALIADLVDALEDALEFMEGYEDVGDGDYGQPVPNRAMQVCTQIRSALARAKP